MNLSKHASGITKESFSRVVLNLGYFLDQDEMTRVYKKFDINGDGVIDKEEFYKVMGDQMMPSTEEFQKIERPYYDRQKCKDLLCLKQIQDDELFC